MPPDSSPEITTGPARGSSRSTRRPSPETNMPACCSARTEPERAREAEYPSTLGAGDGSESEPSETEYER